MNRTRTRLAVAYMCDSNYNDLTLYSLSSLARHHRTPLTFRFLQVGYHREVPAQVRAFVRACGHTLVTESAPFEAVTAGPRRDASCHAHITDTMYLKAAAIEALANDYDYVLYVDPDTLAFDDLHLESIAGFGELVAACPDLSIGTGFDDPAFFDNCRRSGLSPAFFNSGVLFVNARKWHETRASDRYREALDRHGAACPYFAACSPNYQCALNMAVAGDWRRLPVAWNVQKCAMHTRAWSTATLRHYTGRRKFLPIRRRTCDPREYALLRAINRETGLPLAHGPYDFGLSYSLNFMRRAHQVRKYEKAIADLEQGPSQSVPRSVLFATLGARRPKSMYAGAAQPPARSTTTTG